MRKLLGASAILLASFVTAYMRLRIEKEGLQLLHALSQSLLMLRDELTERQRGLSDCFCIIADKNRDETVGRFYATLAEEMRTLGERSFAEIWCSTAETCFASMGEPIVDLTVRLGACLGSSELERQCAALDAAARRLEEKETEEREQMRERKKLSFTLSLSAGAFLVIMLM